MPKSKKTIQAQCPCCGQAKHRTAMVRAVAQMEMLERRLFRHYKELNIDSYDSIVGNDFEWACDACLQSGAAIEARPELQLTSGYPHLAFSDTKAHCRRCESEFAFSKEEKRFWYEERQFNIHSFPENCPGCRKEIRALRRENKKLSTILRKAESDLTLSELEEIISIYTKWGNVQKAAYYRSLQKKRFPNSPIT